MNTNSVWVVFLDRKPSAVFEKREEAEAFCERLIRQGTDKAIVIAECTFHPNLFVHLNAHQT